MKTKFFKVYIASPYTKGDVEQNVKAQIDCAQRLYEAGVLPFAPLLFHFHHQIHPRTYEAWMETDLAWLEACDFLIRLEGESEGADREVKRAQELGMPIFHTIEGLLRFVETITQWNELQPPGQIEIGCGYCVYEGCKKHNPKINKARLGCEQYRHINNPINSKPYEIRPE